MRIFIINIALFSITFKPRPFSGRLQEDAVDVDSPNEHSAHLCFLRRWLLMQVASVSKPAPAKARNKTRSGAVSMAWRLSVASRIAAALVGGYLLTALASICLAQFLPRFLPLARAEAVVLAMTVSFLLYLPAVLWCFACRSAWRAWIGLLAPSAVLAVLYAASRWLP